MQAKIVKLTTEKFGSWILSVGLNGYAIYVEGQGFLRFKVSNNHKETGIKIPYIPCGGKKALKKIMETMDLSDEKVFEYVRPGNM